MAKDEALRGIFTLQRCDLKDLPMPLATASFDVVIVTQVLHHLSDGTDDHAPVYALMAELGRVITPGGGFLWCQTQTQAHHAAGIAPARRPIPAHGPVPGVAHKLRRAQV
jgi:SAM-dependent methyltransferase